MKQTKQRARTVPSPSAKAARALKLEAARASLARDGKCTLRQFELMDAAGDFANGTEPPRVH